MIKIENLKPGLCPFCGTIIRGEEKWVNITLNDQSIMPQPSCDGDLEKLSSKKGQMELLAAIQTIWLFELADSEMTEENRAKEIKRIMNLKIKYD